MKMKKKKDKKNKYTYVKLYIVDLSKINDLGKYVMLSPLKNEQYIYFTC